MFFALSFAIFCIHSISHTQPIKEPGIEEIVITATRTQADRGSLGSSVFVLSREDIKASGKGTVVDLLKTVPGVFVKQTGGAGGATSISLRGIAYKYTLVLVDGMKLADYMGNGGSGQPVLDHFQLDEIERIEIVYGPQSTLWGSDAVGGVIQIITRSGGLEKNAWLSEELGSHGSYKSSFGFSGASGAQDYSFTISRHDIDGFSDALRTNLNLFGGQKEEDGYANLSARINLGFQHKGDAKTRFLLQRIRSKKDLDGFFDSNGPTDQNSTSETRDLYYRIEHRRSPQSQKFEEVYSFSSMRFDSLSNLDSISAFGPFAQKTRFVGSVKSLSWQRDYFIEDHLLTLGWELEQNRGDSLNDQDLKSGITAYYLQARLQNSENFSIGLGGRRNQHRSFGSHTTWKIAPSYRLRKMRFYGSYATGFKAPTLFELHSQQKFANNLNQLVLVNNPDLKPALNRGFSLGVENTIGRDTLLSLTLFQNNIENSIKFVFPPFPQVTPFGFVNTGSIETSGFEVALGSSFSQKWSYQAHFTRSKAKEFPSGLQIRREPQHHFQFNLQYQSGADSTWSLNFRQSGGQVERYEGPFAPAQYTKGFKVVDLSYSRQINETNEWGLRVENLLDSDYQEVFGYDTGGQKIYLTLKHYF